MHSSCHSIVLSYKKGFRHLQKQLLTMVAKFIRRHDLQNQLTYWTINLLNILKQVINILHVLRHVFKIGCKNDVQKSWPVLTSDSVNMSFIHMKYKKLFCFIIRLQLFHTWTKTWLCWKKGDCVAAVNGTLVLLLK